MTNSNQTVFELLLGNEALALIVDVGAAASLSKTTPSIKELISNFVVSTAVYTFRDIAKIYEYPYLAAALGGGLKGLLLKVSTGNLNTLKNVGIGAITTTMYAFSGLNLPKELDAASPMVVETIDSLLNGKHLSKVVFAESATVTGLVGLYIGVNHGAKYLANVTVEDALKSTILKAEKYYCEAISNKYLANVNIKDVMPTTFTELCSAILHNCSDAEFS